MGIEEHSSSPCTIFISYAPEDEALQQELLKHLSNLQRQGIITMWYDRKIAVGEDRNRAIEEHLKEASIILLLISANFLSSDYCYGHEMQLALELHAQGLARVIPILLRPVDWEQSPFARLQPLPQNMKPVTQWRNRDEAFFEIVKDIRAAIEHPQAPIQIKYNPISIDANRKNMLERVWKIWIEDFLDQSLHNTPPIALRLQEQPDAVINPWHPFVQEMSQSAHPLPVGTSISQVFDDANRELLILGEPGSGKTTLLLQLARDLLTRAACDNEHPIPVIFNLSSWAVKRQPFTEWLIDELRIRYQVPRRLSQTWLDNDKLLLLLDGLDEVNPDYTEECIKEINAYRGEHGLVPMVVCGRSAEYFAQKVRLVLQSAVVVQPLTEQQVDGYLQLSGSQLETLREALHREPELQELAKTPLMLSILALTYHGESLDNLQGESPLTAREQVFANYVQHMLKRRGVERQYTSQQTKDWLAWLARQLAQRNQSEFYLERMQPDWLPEGALSRLYPGAVRLVTALVSGLFVGLVFGGALLCGYMFNFFRTADPFRIIIGEITVGLLIGLTVHIPRNIQPTEVIVWSWTGILRSLLKATSLRSGLLGGGISTLIIGLLFHFNGSTVRLQYVGMFFIGLIGATISGFVGGVLSKTLYRSTIDRETEEQRPRLVRIFGEVMFRLNIGVISAFIGMIISGLLIGFLIALFTDWVEGIGVGLLAALFFGPITGVSVAISMWIPHRMVSRRVAGRLWISIWKNLIRVRWIVSAIAMAIAIAVIMQITSGDIVGLFLGLFLGLIVGPVNLLVEELISGLSSRELEKGIRVRPNQGIWRSGRNGAMIGVVFGLGGGFLFGLLGSSIEYIVSPSNSPVALLYYGLLFPIPGGIISGLMASLLNGGVAYIQHGFLRLLLWAIGATSRRYARFLDYAHERILLRKIGGGYVFSHRQLLDFFATSPEQSFSLKSGLRVALLLMGVGIIFIVSIVGVVGYDVIDQYEHNPTLKYGLLSPALIAANPYPSYLHGHGILVKYDPLNQPNMWAEVRGGSTGSCLFLQGAYHISLQKTYSTYSCATSSTFSDFAIEAEVEIIKGDCGGFIIRYNDFSNSGYKFDICKDANYYFIGNAHILKRGSNHAIHKGLGQMNLVAVVAQGSEFDLYVNGKKIDSVRDNSYNEGSIALIADDVSHPTEVAYSHARIWVLD